jgi:hypothetical protein
MPPPPDTIFDRAVQVIGLWNEMQVEEHALEPTAQEQEHALHGGNKDQTAYANAPRMRARALLVGFLGSLDRHTLLKLHSVAFAGQFGISDVHAFARTLGGTGQDPIAAMMQDPLLGPHLADGLALAQRHFVNLEVKSTRGTGSAGRGHAAC